jgi:translation initiation factor 1
MIHIPDSIFPLNDAGQPVCPKCCKVLKGCTCPSGEPPPKKAAAFTPYIRLEKSGRQGKSVTVIRRLPGDEKVLKELARELKARTASGGTYYIGEDGGTIEVQGDHQAAVRKLLETWRA